MESQGGPLRPKEDQGWPERVTEAHGGPVRAGGVGESQEGYRRPRRAMEGQ